MTKSVDYTPEMMEIGDFPSIPFAMVASIILVLIATMYGVWFSTKSDVYTPPTMEIGDFPRILNDYKENPGDPSNLGVLLLKIPKKDVALVDEIRKMHRMIDEGIIPAFSLCEMLIYIRDHAEEITGGKGVRKLKRQCNHYIKTNKFPYEGLKKVASENTSVLGNKGDRSVPKDLASKYTYFDEQDLPKTIRLALEKVPHWKFYQKLNKLKKKVSDVWFRPVYQKLMDDFCEAFDLKKQKVDIGYVRSLRYLTTSDGAMNPHYDMTVITMLIQRGVNALQFKHPVSGKTMTVNIPDGYMLIQFGYLAQLLSKGIVVPNYHGVGPVTGQRDMLIAFGSLDPETKLEYSSPLIHRRFTPEQALEIEKKNGIVFAGCFPTADIVLTVKEFNEATAVIASKNN